MCTRASASKFSARVHIAFSQRWCDWSVGRSEFCDIAVRALTSDWLMHAAALPVEAFRKVLGVRVPDTMQLQLAYHSMYPKFASA